MPNFTYKFCLQTSRILHSHKKGEKSELVRTLAEEMSGRKGGYRIISTFCNQWSHKLASWFNVDRSDSREGYF